MICLNLKLSSKELNEIRFENLLLSIYDFVTVQISLLSYGWLKSIIQLTSFKFICLSTKITFIETFQQK